MKIFQLMVFCIFFIPNIVFSDYANQINEVINRTDPHVNIGIKIKNLDQNKVVFSLNENRNFTYASSVKFITYAVLGKYFGFDKKFITSIIESNNDFYLKVHDPNFQLSDLNKLLNEFKSKHGSKIQGNFYIINEQFSLPAIAWEKGYDDTLRCYGARIDKVHLNKNCIMLNAAPTTVGQSIKITKAESFPYNIKNNAITSKKSEMDRLITYIDDNSFVIEGTLNHSTGRVPIATVAENGVEHLHHSIIKMFKDKEFQISGKVLITDRIPEGKIIVQNVKSYQNIAAYGLKRSDNFITDYIIAEYATQNGMNFWEEASSSLKQLAQKYYNVDITKARLRDGSGISRKNAMTVGDFAKFLDAVAKNKDFPTIKHLMTIPGEDGMLKNRFKDIENLYAKTGHLTGITSLVGYFYDKNNELHSFVIVINNYLGQKKKYDYMQEEIIRLFL